MKFFLNKTYPNSYMPILSHYLSPIYPTFLIILPISLNFQVIRQLPKTRRCLDEEVLLSVISQFHFDRRDALLALLGLSAKKNDTKAPCIEVEFYLTLISAIYLLDKERLEQAREILDNLLIRAGNNLGQRRSMDPLNAKIYFYHRYYYKKLADSSYHFTRSGFSISPVSS